jgi:hypothetical protein
MIACDGANLVGARIEKGYCGKCEDALIKRAKLANKPQGEK